MEPMITISLKDYEEIKDLKDKLDVLKSKAVLETWIEENPIDPMRTPIYHKELSISKELCDEFFKDLFGVNKINIR